MSSSSSEHHFSLPSIRELFPDHLMNHPPPPPSTIIQSPSHAPRHHGHSRSVQTAHGPKPLVSYPQAQSATAAHPIQTTSSPSKLHSIPITYNNSSSNSNSNNAQRSTGDYLGPRDPNGSLSSSATLAPRQPDAPHSSRQAFDGSPAFRSQPMSLPTSVGHDNHQRGRQGHPAVSISQMHSERTPRSQDAIGHPEPSTMPPSDHPSRSPWALRDSGASSGSPSTQALEDPENPSDDDTLTAGTPGIPRKHICPMCHKAFNRPSSLKIHYNTHTGATPFRCPWPKCGREFNVNSNMRRHLRNHTANSNQESQEDGGRRRRRRSSAGSTNPVTEPQGETRNQLPGPPHQYVDPDTSRHYTRYNVYEGYDKDYPSMDVDDADDYHVSENPHRSIRATAPVTRVMEKQSEPRGQAAPTSRYPYASQREYRFHHHSNSSSSASMRLRALTPGSSFHSSSPSPSPSPSLSPSSISPINSPPSSTVTSPVHSPVTLPQTQYQYSPSMPYLRGVRDSHVSTALRPAFGGPSQASHR